MTERPAPPARPQYPGQASEAPEDRLTMATVQARNQRYFWIILVLQAIALAAGAYLWQARGEVGYLISSLAVAPLGAMGYGLLTMYHFKVIQDQRRG